MPFKITEFEATPNPNAVKCHLDRPISRGTRSFLRPESGADDPIASRLFAIAGVTSIMLCGEFLTVNKTDDANWSTIKAKVKKTLGEIEETGDGEGF